MYLLYLYIYPLFRGQISNIIIITVVVLCVCMYVCVSTHTCRLAHWNYKTEIPTDSSNFFADFPKNASFKRYGVICLPRAAPAS